MIKRKGLATPKRSPMKLDCEKPKARARREATQTVNVNIVKKIYNQTFKGVGNVNFEKQSDMVGYLKNTQIVFSLADLTIFKIETSVLFSNRIYFDEQYCNNWKILLILKLHLGVAVATVMNCVQL